MTRSKRPWFIVVVTLCVVVGAIWAQTADKPLGEQEIVTLLGLGIDAEAVSARIKKGGVSFEVNDAALEKLKQAGAGDAVLAAVRSSAKPKASVAPADAVTYEQVQQLLSLGIGEDAILKRLERSPTIFTLDARQTEALKKAGATDKLLAAMAGQRPSAAISSDISDLAIILDCSGSMRELTPEREMKMAAAKRVVTDLVQKIPEGLNVTFVIYGHEAFGAANDPRNCKAVKVVRPLSPLDISGKAQLTQLISGLQPIGATPIALALRTAGQELAKNNALSGVVLVTDGLESCQGDPAAEAAALLANLKVTFGVNVIGFGVKPEENAALQSIAEAGKGKYYAAADAAALTAAIAAIALEIQAQAKPPEAVTSSRRAIKVVEPAIELAPMKEIILAEAGAAKNVLNAYARAKVAKYGEEIRIPSPTAKYDIWWVPNDGHPIVMVKDFNLPERKVVDIKPEEYLGLIQVKGSGMAKQIVAVPPGTAGNVLGAYTVQAAKKYGDIMVVPKGKYDIWVDTNVIEEGLAVEAGKLHALE
jgi:hypothetical protein